MVRRRLSGVSEFLSATGLRVAGMTNDEQLYAKAMKKYKARCRDKGAIFDQPSNDSGEVVIGDEVFVVLRNVNGVLAMFRVVGSGKLVQLPWIRKGLAEALRGQAQWRAWKAEEYPEDDRNLWWSQSLTDAADYVESMFDDDPRLIQIAAINMTGDDEVWLGEEASRFASRCDTNPDDFLTELTSVMLKDHAEWLAEYACEGDLEEV